MHNRSRIVDRNRAGVAADAKRPLFCFTLDTEPDDLWDQQGPCTFEHFKRKVLPEFHRLLISAGARPTYLTTSEVVENSDGLSAIESCLEMGSCEIGAHFHSWTREWPFPVPDLRSSPVHALAHQLGVEVEGRMLAYTCEALKRVIGEAPRSYRGGKYSLSSDSIANLVKCGITVDSTVTPGQSWRDPGTSPLLDGPDFTMAPRQPYYLARGENITNARSTGDVLELPVGAAWSPSWTQRLSSSRTLHHVLRKTAKVGLPVGYTWLRPTMQTRKQLGSCLRQLKHDGVPVWVSLIHSSEISHCRHLPDDESVSKFVQRCLQTVEMALELGARACTLQEAAAAFRGTALEQS
jgi:hypothetical protein